MKKIFTLLLLAVCLQAQAVVYLQPPVPRQHIANAPISVAVTTSSAVLIAGNINRTAMSCTNLGTNSAFLAYGSNAAIVNGGTAIAGGTTWWMDDYLFTTQAIQVIGSGTTTLACQEFQ